MALRDYARIVRRRRWTVVATIAVCLVLALGYSLFTKPLYESTASLLVEDGSREYTRDNTGEPFGDVITLPGHGILTQIEVLQGRDFLASAYAEANVPPKAARVQVKRVFDTDVLAVSAQSRKPEYAGRLAALLPGAYIRFATDTRRREITLALDFARQRLSDEKVKLAAADMALQKYRDANGITDLDKQREAGITAARGGAANVERLQQDVAGSEAKLAALRAYRGSLPSANVSPTSVTNTNIGILRDRIATFENERARMIVLYKSNSPKVQEIDAQIGDLKRRVAHTPATVTSVTRTRNSAVVEYEQRIADQRGILNAQRRELAQASTASASASNGLKRYAGLERHQDALQRDVDAHKGTVVLLATNVESLGIRAKAAHSPATVVSQAGPVERIAPRRVNALGAALLGGLLLGLALALLAEHLDERIQTQGDARSVLGSPIVGLIPPLPDAPALGVPAEGYRALRANVQFASLDRPIRSILVCSTVDGEGKTTTAMNLAVSMALGGKRVVLVDADLRSPSVGERLNIPAYPGVSDYILGRVPLSETFHSTSVDGLRVIPAGDASGDAVDALTLARIGAFHTALREHCDVAVFDGPPILAAAEAQVLAAALDAVLYVVELGGTPKPMLVQAGDLLVQARAHILGIVANRADMKSNGYGTYGQYGRPGAARRPELFRPSAPALPQWGRESGLEDDI